MVRLASIKPMNHKTHAVLAIMANAIAVPSSMADYSTAVLADQPEAYYRFDDDSTRLPKNLNHGSSGAAGDAVQNLARVHTMPGAVLGDSNRASFFDFTSRTEIPWNAAMNPPNNQPFTVEAWFYPASDQTANGQAPLTNRFAYSGLDRQGWVFFQRKPSAAHFGNEPVGWTFRMFRGSGSATGLDVVSGVPYEIGKWTHVVVVYDPKNVNNAQVSMYIDGEFAKSTTWTGGPDGLSPGYKENTNNHNPVQAIYGPAGLAVGNYNNTAGTSLNPYFGGVDEFAMYGRMLTPEEIRSHYQNARNPQRTVAYDELVRAKEPIVYLRLDELSGTERVVVNMGEQRAVAHATHTAEVRNPAGSALKGRMDDGAAAYSNRNGVSVTTMPWTPGNNPDAGTPFTVSMWVKPMRDQQGGQSPVSNRYAGGGSRTGWVMFQRNPNLTYPASEGHGWTFRMFRGSGNSGSDVTTNVDYKIGEWQHLVYTWEPQFNNGDPGNNGNSQWEGILSVYVNGVLAGTNPAALYAANREFPDVGLAADLAIGGYNAQSGLGSNPFEGSVDEFAVFSNYVMSAEKAAELYAAGIADAAATNYETLVFSAPFTGPERQGPQTYLRFGDAARSPVSNHGSLGGGADGSILMTENTATGPVPPSLAGFETENPAVRLEDVKQWVSLNQPQALEIEGQVTLEAWVRPDAVQAVDGPARIVAHGPEILTSFGGVPPVNAIAQTSELSLRIENLPGTGLSYVVGMVGTNVSGARNLNGAAFPVPAADLGGQWVHLAGTYDGTAWKLFRNGVEVASVTSAVGASAAATAEWAIGAAGHGWGGRFAGSIDEVAIYKKALTPAQIAAHFATAVTGGTSGLGGLTIAQTSTGVELTWSAGILQQADSVEGPYVDVAGAASPYGVMLVKPRMFFRLRK